MDFRDGRPKDSPLNNALIQKIMDNRRLELLVRWILGVTFVYASFHKIIAPAAFARIIYGYGLFPEVTVNVIAIVLPYIELVTGLALLTGLFPRAASLIIMVLLLSFIAAISINLLRGYEFNCGCFNSDNSNSAGSAGLTLVRDFVLLFICIQVYRFKPDSDRILSVTQA